MNILKYNSNLNPFAKQLRSNMTLAEVLLWKRLNRQQLGVQFNRQKPIAKWVVDFYCKELQLAIEVDGNSHNFKKEEDDERQRKMESLGIRFLRFWDCEIKDEMESVIERIERWIQENPPRLSATPPVEGNKENPPRLSATPPVEGNKENPPPLRDPSKGGEQNTATEIPSTGGVPERRGGSKDGAALIVVMWVLIIVSLIVSTFAFEMQLESRLISAQRKRFKADQLALAGVELAKAMLAFEEDPLEGDDIVYDDPYLKEASKIAEGAPVHFVEEFGDGTITLRIDFEKGRQNVHKMSAEEWTELFDQGGVDATDRDSLLGCLTDWEDPGDAHQINGAEKDDPFYREQGYEPKNAPIDTIDELLLIKNWTQEILYGNMEDEEAETPMSGIAQHLTIWGDGKINPNSASREVLNSLNISEQMVDTILDIRLGPDGEAGTEDDETITPEEFAALGLSGDVFTLKPEYVNVISEGSVGGLVSTISAVFKLGEKESVPLFWLEE